MITAGIDVGSVNTKLVVFDRATQTIFCEKVVPTGPRPRETAHHVLSECRSEHRDLADHVRRSRC